MKNAVFDTLFVTSAKVRLIREGAYTENAQIAFENYPYVALAMMNLPKEERENAFAKMAKMKKGGNDDENKRNRHR